MAIRRWIPPAVADALGSALPDRLQRFEVVASWDEAARRCIGYEQSTLNDRDSLTDQGTTQTSEGRKNDRPTSRDLQFIAAVGICLEALRPGLPVRVLDFGGAFGHYFDVASGAFPTQSWDWTVVETPTMATLAAGTRGDPSISWTSDLGSVLRQRWDLVFASASLNYVPHPIRLLSDLGRLAPYALITRLPLWPVDRHLPAVQRLSRTTRAGAYPVWIFSEADFLEAVGAIGEVVLRFDVPEDTAWIAGHRGTFTGLLIRTGDSS